MTFQPRISGANLKTSAAWNRGLAVRLLREHKSLSRRQISQMTGLRGSTLTYIMRELQEKDVVQTVGKVNSRGVGQKQVLLRINPDLGWTLGVSLRPGRARMVMLDAAGGTIGSRMVTGIAAKVDEVPGQLEERLKGWLSEVGTPAGKMLGLGVGVTGVVDAAEGVLLRSTSFDATEVPLQRMLVERFGVPTVIDHDACMGARAEAAEGAARPVTHFVYFLANHEVRGSEVLFNSYGAALYLEGKVYRGAHYGAGELGPTLAPPHVPMGLEDLAELESKDGKVTPALEKLAAGIGWTLAGLVNVIDLEMAIIGGGTAAIVSEAFMARVNDEMARSLVPVPRREVRVAPTGVGAEAVARGGAIAASDAALMEGRWDGAEG